MVPQIPGALTTSSSKYVNVIPLEVAGWVLRHQRIEKEVPWILCLSHDPAATLAANLLSRLPTNVNLVAGFAHVKEGGDSIAVLERAASEVVVPLARTLDTLVPVAWGRLLSQGGVRVVGSQRVAEG